MGNTCKSMADSCQCMAKPLQYCKVISFQLKKINEKIKKNKIEEDGNCNNVKMYRKHCHYCFIHQNE